MTKKRGVQSDEMNNKPDYRLSEPGLEKINLKTHWNKAYERTSVSGLGWYEDNPEPSMRLINMCSLDKSAVILNVGAGATTLVDALLKEGYERVVANDLSAIALEKLKERLGPKSSRVEWIVDDLTHPDTLARLGEIDLWHDRATLHFFLEEVEQETYFDLLKSLVKKGGYVIIAVFDLEGAQKCSGLPVHRYSASMLVERLGDGFELIETFDYTYVTPSGTQRKYVYTLFSRFT